MICFICSRYVTKMILGGGNSFQSGEYILFLTQLLKACQSCIVCLQSLFKLLCNKVIRTLKIPCQRYLVQQIVPDFTLCVWLYLLKNASATPIISTPSFITLDKITRIHIAVQGIEMTDVFSFLIIQLTLKQALSQQIPFFIPAKQFITLASHGLTAYVHLSLSFVAL